ncbi:mitochondrial carrier homolog 2-like [Schistocerca americana]|uniref:mitochondrial carrier homolog 2-like n=1 Tax=Schistocerca americana TaxID=7009 RepID=UPI001F503CE2|nr:mitochondrial carrier homolog 2-like [Schistocerca americana]
MSEKLDHLKWVNLGLRVGGAIILHPVEYAKVLIQIGYEPIKPYPTKTLFGKPALALPNVFQYVSYIKTIDGVSGCFRGISPRLSGIIVNGLVYSQTSTYLGGDKYLEECDESRLSEQERFSRLVNKLTIDITARTAGIIASQPLAVITYRMMAQFIGGEDKYSNIFSSIVEIYRENGIGGYFSGLIPRLLGELSAAILVATLEYAIKNFFAAENDKHRVVSSLASFFVSSLTHPFVVVSTCMAVVDSGLAAGRPPHMPLYTSWICCWSHLSRAKQLKRGSSLVFRYYTGPYSVPTNDSKNIEKTM